MMKRCAGALIGALLLLSSVSARAATTFEYLFTDGYPLSMTPDGTAIAGNNVSDYGPFRWTQATGRVSLGMASGPTVGSGGTPGISADGTRVASTILSQDSTYSTAGLWTLGSGWQWLMPPTPPGGGISDRSMGDIWGLSGDGNTAVGLFWRPGGRAHAFAWTQATGAVDLGSAGNASRPNGVSYDGSVIGGWDESLLYGYRSPAAWLNGTRIVLAQDSIGEVSCVSSNGEWLGGFQRDASTDQRSAALWHHVGNGIGPIHYLGVVPGSYPSYGLNTVYGVTADGKLAVGFCSFAGDPFYTTGFVWTDSTGVIDVNVFLANQGILPDQTFTIQSLNCVSPDGTKILGYGRDVAQPYTRRAFMIRLDRATLSVPGATPLASLRVAASPNPVRGATTLSFTLPSAAEGGLVLLDGAGRVVRRLLAGTIAAGPHQVAWDGRDDRGAPVAAGVYFPQLHAGGLRAVSKIVVLH